jgi:adenine-specific DNA-methyltransferase
LPKNVYLCITLIFCSTDPHNPLTYHILYDLMQFNLIPTTQNFNATYAAMPIDGADLAVFEAAITVFLQNTDRDKQEEYIKNESITFLRKTFYPESAYHINTHDRNDLVIRNGAGKNDPITVILEYKNFKNTEMVTKNNLNTKALHELLRYYMQETVEHKNVHLQHLVITDGAAWYVFRASAFANAFSRKPDFVKTYTNFAKGLLSQKTTDYFYKEIAQPFIESSEDTIEYVYFNIREAAHSDEKKQDIFKFLHPQHLLNLPLVNDSNALNQPFYDELLHLLGLEEVKDGGKKLIQRVNLKNRQEGSLLENTLTIITTDPNFLELPNLTEYGQTLAEQAESVALELCITWLNRILFMKLLEGQLARYHKGNKAYTFMQYDYTHQQHEAERFDFDQLNQLFFEVMAVPQGQRNAHAERRFGHLPYLNSALFERTDLERKIIRISNLKDNLTLALYPSTVLRDERGQRIGGQMPFLRYLLTFLSAFDFAAQGNAIIRTNNKTLINAAVLGLIFEKLNGYRDGSFFTPGFITMYMCRQTIRQAVVNKYNAQYGWDGTTIKDINNLLARNNVSEADGLKTLHSVRICDPAVGSGHFLVSALNELLLIQNELFLLHDADGDVFRHYTMTIENDEFLVRHRNAPFDYDPEDIESARMQQALFNAKRLFIENCLFGADINPKSVAICQLRLWIELLKNAYYIPAATKVATPFLQTLPNIDINIKTGNSLVSRYAIDFTVTKLRKTPLRTRYNTEFSRYKQDVFLYKSCTDRAAKDEIRKRIKAFKALLVAMHRDDDIEYTKVNAQRDHLLTLSGGLGFNADDAKVAEITAETEKLAAMEAAYKEKQRALYHNALEWRFEFPEVLDDDGGYIGFDAVVGNPPYIQLQSMPNGIVDFYKTKYKTFARTGDIYGLFYERGNDLLKAGGLLNYITSNKWMRAEYGRGLRAFFATVQPLELIDLGGGVFDTATVDTNVLHFQKAHYQNPFAALDISKEKKITDITTYTDRWLTMTMQGSDALTILNPAQHSLRTKIANAGKPLKDWDVRINRGVLTGYNEAFIIDTKTKNYLCDLDPRNSDIIKPILRGRDIKKYKAEWAGLWLIGTYNGEMIANDDIKQDSEGNFYYTDTETDKNIPITRQEIKTISVTKDKVLRVRVNRVIVETDYPTIYTFLKTFEPQLKKREDKGDHWTNLRNCTYYKDFDKEKIVYPNMTLFLPFIFDDKGYYANQKCFILTSSSINLKMLTGILNSKVAAFWIKDNCPELQGGTRELSKIYFEHIPIPTPSTTTEAAIIALVEEIMVLKQDPAADTTAQEAAIDAMVYALYGLTAAEIAVVEG